MTTITQLAQQSELALASYGNLSGNVLTVNALRIAGLSTAQANQFIARYKVIDQYNVDSGTGVGLSATVFDEKTPDSPIFRPDHWKAN